ncbi:MAG: hypothetical protein AAFN59_09840 [Pseudomonadota bacterium]
MTGTPRADLTLRGLIFRFVILLVVVIAATWAVHLLREALNLEIMPENEQAVHRAIMLGSLAYIGLLALPFVPGAEIGLAMLTAFGPAIAPLVYTATVAAMMLAFTIGRFLPITALAQVFKALRMRRAADLITRAAPLSDEARLQMLLDGAPPRLVALALRRRYIALAIAVNIPGNAIIGGGGGIMIMTGMSGLFSPLATALTIAIAVSPVPLVIMFLGA